MGNDKKYPIWGCEEIGQGKQGGYGVIITVNNKWTRSVIISDICTQCGYILSMKVKNPEKFKKKK
ncbi:MAG: transcription initiation factor TFIIIB [Clostridiaceae bacterium]